MINRQTGYCVNCGSNVVHVRVFQRRLWYLLDRCTLSFVGRLGFGPWQCVDCDERNMSLLPRRKEVRIVSDQAEEIDPTQSVGNFIRTEQSLAHAVTDESRFSNKYRMGIVEKLLEGKSTVSRTSQQLGVGELTLQRWIKDYLQQQLEKTAGASGGSVIAANSAGSPAPESVNWSADEAAGMVIESKAIRRPR